MDMDTDNNYNQIFSKRTKSLTITIINELSDVPYSDKISNIRKQIFRSASSTASNYRAMCRARSLKEKYSKICIVVEEADEIVKATSSYKKKLSEDLKRINNQL